MIIREAHTRFPCLCLSSVHLQKILIFSCVWHLHFCGRIHIHGAEKWHYFVKETKGSSLPLPLASRSPNLSHVKWGRIIVFTGLLLLLTLQATWWNTFEDSHLPIWYEYMGLLIVSLLRNVMGIIITKE